MKCCGFAAAGLEIFGEGGLYMFGYVKPYAPELLVKEYEFYKGTYCGVCRAMKKYTGALSNALHSYDSVFLALVRMLYIDSSRISAKKRRCALHPIKSRVMLEDNEALEYTARAFGILTYYKLMDDIKDERLLKRAARGLLRPIFSSAKSRAALKEISELCSEKLSAIDALEAAGEKSVDKPAELFGELLGGIFSAGLEGEGRLVTYHVGLHLGRFIYAADAAEDYGNDRNSGSYNPFVLLYGAEELTYENKQSIKCALLLECRELESAVNLLPFGKLKTIEGIISNIIYEGLPRRIEFLDAGAPENRKGED